MRKPIQNYLLSRLKAGVLFALLGANHAALAQEGLNPSVIDPSSYNELGTGTKTYQLVKNPSGSDVLAVLEVDEKGAALLRSKVASVHGDCCSFHSIEEATEAWGPSRHSGGYETFDLRTRNGEPNLFHVDVKFSRLGATAYRVRGIGIQHPKWLAVSIK